MTSSSPLPVEQKRRALDQALTSDTFAKADQLRRFLRYIGEMELTGKSGQISEYTVGVEALGRPEGFSPAEDSTVRTRARSLRDKLRELYTLELPLAAIRIDLPKGSYTPHFIEVAPQSPFVSPEPAPPVPMPPPSQRRNWLPWSLALLSAAALVAVLATRPHTNAPDPLFAEAWGPLAQPAANVLICVGSPPFLVVHGYPQFVEGSILQYPAPPAIKEEWTKYRPTPPGELTMHHIDSVAQIGAISAVATTAATLSRFGSGFQVLAERSVPVAALARRNVIQIGSPEYSNNVSALLERTPFTVRFDPASRDFAVSERPGPHSRNRVYLPRRDSAGHMLEVFGLISVTPSEGSPDNGMRSVVFSGSNNVGAQGAAEVFSSPRQMRRIRDLFARDGQLGFPQAYQIVVRCKTHLYQLVSAEYEAHQAIDWKTGNR